MIQTLITLEHDPKTTGVLVQRAKQLLADAVESPEQIHDLMMWLGRQYNTAGVPALQIEDGKLQSILGKLRKEQQITEAQAEAFLCTCAPNGVLQALQAMVMVIALKHQELFGDKGRPLRAMAAFRLLAEDREKVSQRLSSLAIEQQLPNSRQALEAWVESLEQVIANVTGPAEKYAQQRLQPMLRIFKDVLAGELENKRVRVKTPPASEPGEGIESTEKPEGLDDPGNSGSPRLERVYVQDVLEAEDEPAYQQLTVRPDPSDDTQSRAEHIADNQETGVLLTAQPDKTTPESLRRSYVLSAMHAKTVAGSIERREKRLICLTSRLSNYERKILLSELRQRLHKCDTAYLLYLVLATGRDLRTLLGIERVEKVGDFKGIGNAYILREDDSEIYLVYRQELPQHRLPEEQKILVNQENAAVTLPIPCDSRAIRELPKLCEQEAKLQVNDLLKEINRANGTRLTLRKITDNLADFLHHRGVDDVIIALLTGNPRIQEAGLYYTQYDTVTLYRTYRAYREIELQVTTKEPDENKAKLGGSKLILTEQAVVSIFEHLKDCLLRAQSQSLDQIHNSYVMYVLHLLNMTTGHRPVRDPFDDIDHIDLVGKKIFISDKESRFTASPARMLVLPDTAALQIELYKEHLENLIVYMESLSPDLAKKIRKVLDGKGPLFFLMEREEKASNLEMVSVTPKTVESFWAGLISIPSNWHRHFLRTYLLYQEEVTGEAIDTWMGHASPGQEGLTLYSGMSIKPLVKIANRLECLLKRLKVVALSSRGVAYE